MIKRWNQFIKEEFVNEPINVEYINARMQELQDIVMDTLECADFEWSIDEKYSEEGQETIESQGQLNISFSPNDWSSQADSAFHNDYKYEFDLDELKLDIIFNEEEVELSQRVSSIEEGLDIIEKDIYGHLGVSESFEDRDPSGKRIELVRMEDPYTKLKPGDKGTCTGVDDMGHILMKWDNGSTLSIVPEVDEFNVIDESKIIKTFEDFDKGEFLNTDESLKQRLIDYYQERESEFDPEETANVLEILNDYGDNLSGLRKYDKVLLLRLIDDNELYQEVDDIGIGEVDVEDKNLFDSVVNESKIHGYDILPQDALKALEEYVEYSDPDNKIEVVRDPRVEGTYAVRVYRKSDDNTFDLLWYKGGYDEVDFEQWPPVSGELKFW